MKKNILKAPFITEMREVTANMYRLGWDERNGGNISYMLDEKEVGKIVLPPYKLQIDGVKKGAHMLELTLFDTRVNTFGGLHAAVPIGWKGPNLWYTDGNMWSYEYRMQDTGIMKKPTITLTK